ncbi:XRE family transcriptional regulator [Murinocardiopsis flavida]|uniref:XRE family transcriptional regulator n=2 Tax=Murinocardiopsis flavida TaxID=645275 RepID=A0A2P8CSZ0_9ACTN|nr:XRE family transcriptional regulator [Murinocardiopsis flavida]
MRSVTSLIMNEPTPPPSTPDQGRDAKEGIGPRLRRRRKAKRFTLAQTARQAELSEGFLSQLERGRVSGSVATLQRVTAVLGLTVGELFDESWSDDTALHRYAEASPFRFGTAARKIRLTPKGNNHLEVFLGEFEPGGTTGDEPYAHGDSEELLLVISGRIEVTLGEQRHLLGPLDSVSYSSATPHRAREADGGTAQVLWSISPPSY